MKSVVTKRVVSLALTILLFAALFPAASFGAGSGKFDLSFLEKSKYYEMDKFEKEWKMLGWYEKEYSDAEVLIGALLFPAYIEKGYGPELRVISYDKKTV